MSLMQIFVSGTWKPEKARPYREQARSLGEQIAAAGFDLACGPGTGIARYAIEGFRAARTSGKVRFYLPTAEDMAAAGETVEATADEVEHTGLDYPLRNVLQVKRSDGLFVLTGGDGALEEILPAVIDYDVPVAIVEGAGSAATAVALLLDVYPDWRHLITLGPDVDTLLGDFLARVTASAAHD
jgi:predicted Rossmann-fold nucleotide-binding protein